MPTISRGVPLLMTLVALMMLALAGPANAQAQLSDEALMLLPADVIGLVVFSSLNDLDAQLLVPLREVADPDEVDEIQIEEILPDDLKSIMDVIDPNQPLAMAFTLGAEYGPPEPVTMVLVPVIADTDPKTMALVSGYASVEVMGNYVALSKDPGYVAAGAVPALAQGLPTGQMVGRIDLETIFAIMRPMIEMMLSSMEEANDSGESPPGVPVVPNPGLQVIRGLMASARVAEFAMDESSGDLELLMGLDIFADSVFDVGPQPPVSDALKLAGHLPDYGEMVVVTAMDLALLYENMPFLKEPSMMQFSKAMAELDNPEAIAWWTAAEALSRPFERAAASTARVYEESFEFVQVAQIDDAAAHLEQIDAHLATLPAAQMGFILELESSETRGDMSYRRYRWDFNSTQMAEMMNEGDDIPDQEDMDELTQFLRAMMPPLHLAAQGKRILVAMVPDGAELDAVLTRFTESPKMPPMALEGLQQWAGSKTQVMGQVELRSFMQEIMTAVASFDPDEAVEIPDGEPVRIRYASQIGEVRHAARLQTRTGALLRFIKQMDELDD